MRRAVLPISLISAVVLTAPAVSQQHGAGGHAPAGGPGPATVPAATNTARIGFADVRPARLDLVTGEPVTWTNDSARVHTVTADDGGYDSGRMASGAAFTHRFAAAGETAYHCTLHPLIQGAVFVHDILLEPPALAASPGRPFPLAGRTAAPAGTPVSIEADDGHGFAPVASAEVGADGRYGARIAPTTSAMLRAVVAGATSPDVRLSVLDRHISLNVHRMRGRVHLRAKVTPASRGGRIVLQLFLPERFGWWPVRSVRPDQRSQAGFAMSSRRRLRARVRYTLADGVTTLATSRIVRIGQAASHASH